MQITPKNELFLNNLEFRSLVIKCLKYTNAVLFCIHDFHDVLLSSRLRFIILIKIKTLTENYDQILHKNTLIKIYDHMLHQSTFVVHLHQSI